MSMDSPTRPAGGNRLCQPAGSTQEFKTEDDDDDEMTDSMRERRQEDPIGRTADLTNEATRLLWWLRLQSVPVLKEDLLYFVLNYFTVMGYNESALRLAEECGAIPELPLFILELRERVTAAILEDRLDDAVNYIQKTEPQILNKNPDIHFKLRQEQLLRLIEEKDDRKALTFAQTYLAPCVKEHPHLLPQLEDAMTRLAFPDMETTEKKETPLAESGTDTASSVAKEVDDAVLDYFSVAKDSALECAVKSLIWTQHQLVETPPDHPMPFMISPTYGGLLTVAAHPMKETQHRFCSSSSSSLSLSSPSSEESNCEHCSASDDHRSSSSPETDDRDAYAREDDDEDEGCSMTLSMGDHTSNEPASRSHRSSVRESGHCTDPSSPPTPSSPADHSTESSSSSCEPTVTGAQESPTDVETVRRPTEARNSSDT